MSGEGDVASVQNLHRLQGHTRTGKSIIASVSMLPSMSHETAAVTSPNQEVKEEGGFAQVPQRQDVWCGQGGLCKEKKAKVADLHL